MCILICFLHTPVGVRAGAQRAVLVRGAPQRQDQRVRGQPQRGAADQPRAAAHRQARVRSTSSPRTLSRAAPSPAPAPCPTARSTAAHAASTLKLMSPSLHYHVTKPANSKHFPLLVRLKKGFKIHTVSFSKVVLSQLAVNKVFSGVFLMFLAFFHSKIWAKFHFGTF